MKKLGAAIQYECMTSFKYIWVFYGIQFAVIAFIYAIGGVSTGNFEKIGTSCLETNTLVYVGVLGVLGFKEDFKMLIQNGFTRKYIFLATVSLFAFISGIMAAVDTVVGNVLNAFLKNYDSVFGAIYGYEHSLFANWLWLFLVYMLVCSLFYTVILVINKIGKTLSIYMGIALGAVVLIIPAVFRFALPGAFTKKFVEFWIKGMGFMPDGAVNLLYPAGLLLLLAGAFGICSYAVIRRTELR